MANGNKRNGRNGKKPGKRAYRRSRADVVLAQGVGQTVPRAFGSIPLPTKCWDAFHPSHAGLPRSVGPYAVVRTSNLLTSGDQVMIFGTFLESTNQSVPAWTNVCAIGSGNDALAINAASNANYFTVPLPGTKGGAASTLTAVPAAISVQVLNPNALQTTTGIMAGAVCPMQFQIGGSTATWSAASADFVSYFKPRMMSAGKLALRGVQMDSYPLDMSEVSSFKQVSSLAESSSGTVFTWLGNTPGTVGTDSLIPAGWAPMVVFNPSGVELNYLVSVEWRVRFDIENPAVSSHRQHPISTDASWDKKIQSAIALGHGVMDIVERVANYGAAAGRLALRGARTIPALMDA